MKKENLMLVKLGVRGTRPAELEKIRALVRFHRWASSSINWDLYLVKCAIAEKMGGRIV